LPEWRPERGIDKEVFFTFLIISLNFKVHFNDLPMTANKTQPGTAAVEDFLAKVTPLEKQQDCFKILEILQKETNETPILWGGNMVGFGTYHYKYETGREGDWFVTGFAPRAQNITLYLLCGLDNQSTLLQQLGKYKIGKSCLYIKQLKDINIDVLKKLVQYNIQEVKRVWG